MIRIAGRKDADHRECDGCSDGRMYQGGHYVAVRYIRERLKALEKQAPNFLNIRL